MNKQIEKALEGDTRAAEFLANRAEGLAKATIETTEVKPIEVILSNEGYKDLYSEREESEEGSN